MKETTTIPVQGSLRVPFQGSITLATISPSQISTWPSGWSTMDNTRLRLLMQTQEITMWLQVLLFSTCRSQTKSGCRSFTRSRMDYSLTPFGQTAPSLVFLSMLTKTISIKLTQKQTHKMIVRTEMLFNLFFI